MHQLIEFLQDKSAVIDTTPTSILEFNDAELPCEDLQDTTHITALLEYAVISVSGGDARDFLNNQISNDMADVNTEQAIQAVYCDPKGQVLADFTILQNQDGYLLICHHSIIDATLKRLKMFVMRSKVVLENASDRYALAGLYIAGKALPELSAIEQLNTNSIHCDDRGITYLCVNQATNLYWLIASPAQLMALWQDTLKDVQTIRSAYWRYHDITQGKAHITATTSGQHIAQTLNYDLTAAIHFKKGCYPGQEVIARLHYRGKPTKRLAVFHFDDPSSHWETDKITLQYAATKETTIVPINQCSFSNTNQSRTHFILAIISLKPLASANGVFQLPTGQTVQVIPLPYEYD